MLLMLAGQIPIVYSYHTVDSKKLQLMIIAIPNCTGVTAISMQSLSLVLVRNLCWSLCSQKCNKRLTVLHF